MKQLIPTTNSLVLFLVTTCMVTFSSCDRASRYFTGDLNEDAIAGIWVLPKVPSQAHQAHMPAADCQLQINRNGSFCAKNFPLIVAFSPGAKIKLVSESGTWRLVDERLSNKAYRWKLHLSFSESRYDVEWDIIGRSKSVGLFGRTDLDYWVGFEFVRPDIVE